MTSFEDNMENIFYLQVFIIGCKQRSTEQELFSHFQSAGHHKNRGNPEYAY
jgi:hypothetical protein